MDLNGMNGSIGPLSAPVQAVRPYRWANYAAVKTLDMLKGSYVFDGEPRIIQDPESLRATVWRVGSLWEAWARLRDTVLIQMNSSDHNPTVRPDWSPSDAPELNTPQLLKYYVKGGKFSNGKHGYIFSNSNWDPYPLVNDVEAFQIPLANLMVAVVERVHRFEDPFFTVTKPEEVLAAHGGVAGVVGPVAQGGGGAAIDAVWQELKPLANPVPPDGVTADKGVGDLDAVPMLKLMRLQQALDISTDLLAADLQNAAFWMDVRKLENPSREFGAAPTAAWSALRRVAPFRLDPSAPPPTMSVPNRVSAFLRTTSPRAFYVSTAVPLPGGENPKPPRADVRAGAR
jgi:histidine ammonia-lyase